MTSPYIIDTTLREGSQAPNVYWEIEEVKKIAIMLADFGVNCIEVGHPHCNVYEMEKVSAVVALNLGVPVLAHARAMPCDIEAVKRSGADWVGIFIGLNDISIESKFNKYSLTNLFIKIEQAIQYAKELGLKVRFTLEDTSRTPRHLQVEAFTHAINAGADRICYTDTVGVLSTDKAIEEVSYLKSQFHQTPIEVHFHNDRGLALSNALALRHVADWVSCSVNGIGERCGITDTITFKANLLYEAQQDVPIVEIEKAKFLSKLINAYSRSNVDERAPLVGKHAFTHCADLHIKAYLKNINAYCWINDYPLQKTHRNTKITLETYVNNAPKVISAVELKYHRKGPGNRYVMMDHRVVAGVKQYCIVREINVFCDNFPSYVDAHVHHCDSLFIFLGDEPGYKGLKVVVQLEDQEFEIESPATVFIPSGKKHTYKVLLGKGTFINHVLHDHYDDSLLEMPQLIANAQGQKVHSN